MCFKVRHISILNTVVLSKHRLYMSKGDTLNHVPNNHPLQEKKMVLETSFKAYYREAIHTLYSKLLPEKFEK